VAAIARTGSRLTRYLLVTRGGPSVAAAARWLRAAAPMAAVTVLCVPSTPILAWWSEEPHELRLMADLATRQAEGALDLARQSLGLPETRVRAVIGAGRVRHAVLEELARDRYAGVALAQGDERGLGRLDVPVTIVPPAPATGRLRLLSTERGAGR